MLRAQLSVQLSEPRGSQSQRFNFFRAIILIWPRDFLTGQRRSHLSYLSSCSSRILAPCTPQNLYIEQMPRYPAKIFRSFVRDQTNFVRSLRESNAQLSNESWETRRSGRIPTRTKAERRRNRRASGKLQMKLVQVSTE